MKKLLRIGLFVTASILLTAGIFRLLSMIPQNHVELRFSIKSLDPVPCSLVFSGTKSGRPFSDTVTQQLHAIQFFMPLRFRYSDGEGLERVRLLPQKDSTTIYLESLQIIHYRRSVPDTIFEWQCRNALQKLVSGASGCRLIDHTAQYLEISTDGGRGELELNIAHIISEQAIRRPEASSDIVGMVSLLLAVFFLLALLVPGNFFTPCAMPAMWKSTSRLVKAFSVTLLIVFLNSMFRFFPDMENRENRVMSDMPVLRADNAYSYTDELTKYLTDQFAFRNFFFFLNSCFHTYFLKESSMPEKVIQGSKGWFFYHDEGSVADYRRMSKIDSNLVQYVHQNFSLRMDWLDKRGIKFYFLVPPNKERIYSDYMPARFLPINGLGHNSLDFFKKMLSQLGRVIILDPTDSLLVARRRRDVYYKTDTHWNTYGGFKGYQVLMTAITKDFPNLKPLTDEDFTYSEMTNSEGDLAAMLGMSKLLKRTEYNMVFKDTTKSLNYNFPSTMLLRMSNKLPGDTNKLKLLMFRDSYGSYLIPFLNQHFSETVYAWNYIFMDRLIEQEKPDIVVFESLQRFLLYSILMGNPTAVNASVLPDVQP